MVDQANAMRDAVRRFDEGMKVTMVDYEIALVQETPLLDVFPYETPSSSAGKPEYE